MESSCVHRRCGSDGCGPLCRSSSLVRAAARRSASQHQRTRPSAVQREAVLVEAAKGSQCRFRMVFNVHADNMLGLPAHPAQLLLLCNVTVQRAVHSARSGGLKLGASCIIASVVSARGNFACSAVEQAAMQSCMGMERGAARAVQQAEFLQEEYQTQACRAAKERRKKAREQTANQWTGPSWSCHTCRRLGWLPGSIFTEFGARMCAVLSVKTSKVDPEGCSMC